MTTRITKDQLEADNRSLRDEVLRLQQIATEARAAVPPNTPAQTRADAAQRSRRTAAQIALVTLLVEIGPMLVTRLQGDDPIDWSALARAGVAVVLGAAVAWGMRYLNPPTWPQPTDPESGHIDAGGAVLLLLVAAAAFLLGWLFHQAGGFGG